MKNEKPAGNEIRIEYRRIIVNSCALRQASEPVMERFMIYETTSVLYIDNIAFVSFSCGRSFGGRQRKGPDEHAEADADRI